MNCEQVKELLSAYLDKSLAIEEQREVSIHLQGCKKCSEILADYRYFDTLLSQLPRVAPGQKLRERIFTSSEYLELTGTFNDFVDTAPRSDSSKRRLRDAPGRPQLVALPGGKAPKPANASEDTRHTPIPEYDIVKRKITKRSRRSHLGLRIMQVAIAVSVLLTIAIGSWIGHNLWLQQTSTSIPVGGITPPSSLPNQAPLSAGTRFVFLRNGKLWSTATNGSAGTRPFQLSPDSSFVSADWTVQEPQISHTAGNMIAYINLQDATVHLIRSDRQHDKSIAKLLNSKVSPSSIWDTEQGTAILTSLAWSKDGTMLSFVGDPDGTGQTSLFIYSTQTNALQSVPLPLPGSATHPVWSPDGIRVAFVFTHNGISSIMDYNTQNHGMLTISDTINTQQNPNDWVLTLDWSPDIDAPAITWSIGTVGHVHSVWIRRVGIDGTVQPRALAMGDFAQATYSRAGDGSIGCWLLVSSQEGHATDLWRMNIITDTQPVPLTSGMHVNLAQWSPDGSEIDYLDSIVAGIGKLYVVNVSTGVNIRIATSVTDEPAPAWSTDSQKLVYSNGRQGYIVNLLAAQTSMPLNVQGAPSAFSWSPSAPSDLVVALNNGQPGIYLVDTQHNTALQVDSESTTGPIQWTEIY